jgi:hypothetical protein
MNQTITIAYGDCAAVALAVDGDLLDVTVSGSSGSKSQSAESDDENVLSERRVKHGDCLIDGTMRCTEVLRRANVSEMEILVETVVLEKNQIDQELDPVTFYMPLLKDAIPPGLYRSMRMAPRIPQAGDLSPGHLRHGHGKAI